MDAAVVWRDTGGDVTVQGVDLLAEDSLYSAVILSLFLDRVAEGDDELPDGGTDRRGWWADAWADVDRDRIGSRLWLLRREKQTEQVRLRAQEYAAEALDWLVEDGVAASVDVTAEWLQMGWMGMTIAITRPDGSSDTYNFKSLWEALS